MDIIFEEENKSTKKKPKERPLQVAYDDLQFSSNRLSEQTRYISFGILTFIWLFLAGGSKTPSLPTPPNKHLLIICGGVTLLTLLLDYLHYVFAYFNTCDELDEADQRGKDTVAFNSLTPLRIWRMRMFWWKQWAMIASLITFLYTVAVTFM